MKSSAIFTQGHSRPLALWAVETVTSACCSGDELGDGGQDGVGAVGVDEVDQRLQVASGRVVGGVVLQFAPGGEQDQFGVGGAAALLEVAGGQGQGAQAVPSPGQGDPVSGGQQVHDLGHGADVGAAQHRVGPGEGAEFGGHGRRCR